MLAVVFLAGLKLVPDANIFLLFPVALFDSIVLFIIVYGVVGLTNRRAWRKAFGVIVILLLFGMFYQNSGVLTGGSLKSMFEAEDSGLSSVQQVPGTIASFFSGLGSSVSSSANQQPRQTSTTGGSVSSSTPMATISSTAAISASSPVVESLTNPSFVSGKANITYPADYELLAQYALALVNHDRNQNGLGNITLSTIPSGQQHSDSMAYFGYFSHWDTQGYKPYMRYSLLGGTGAVAENVGMDHCTTSPPSDTLVYPTSCNVQTIENGLANSEYGMMYNDLTCCNNGHRDNILDPQHNRISIGIAIGQQTSAIYFTEDFEDSYVQFSQPIYQGGYVKLVGTATTSPSVSQLVVYYDPTPQPMSVTQLDGTFAYDPGTFVGGVFPPCTGGCSYYPGAVSVYASQWQVSTNSIDIVFSMGDFTADGSGVYTIYLLTGSSTATSLTTYSIFV